MALPGPLSSSSMGILWGITISAALLAVIALMMLLDRRYGQLPKRAKKPYRMAHTTGPVIRFPGLGVRIWFHWRLRRHQTTAHTQMMHRADHKHVVRGTHHRRPS